ncbi:MAG: hypothetical protein O3B43_07020 [Chloroflexi bacterium]|nr:hypothetical protein [Chloroflexota bacterium]
MRFPRFLLLLVNAALLFVLGRFLVFELPKEGSRQLVDEIAREAGAVLEQLAEDAADMVATPTLTPVPSPTPQRDTQSAYSTIDRPDDVEGFQVHFIYAIPSDELDRMMDLSGQIELSANAANHWLQTQTDGIRLRYDTYEEALDITFMRLPYTADELNDLGNFIVDGFDQLLRDYGFDTSRKIYVVYYDGLFVLPPDNLACGQATLPPQSWGLTATIYLRGYAPEYDAISCPALTRTADYAGWLELVLLHELFHLLGAVPECAPNSDGAHVSDSSYDLMSPAFNTNAAPSNVLDANNDDYFNHENADCPDLADSAFLDPLPAAAELPPAWEYSIGPRSFNPFDMLESQ